MGRLRFVLMVCAWFLLSALLLSSCGCAGRTGTNEKETTVMTDKVTADTTEKMLSLSPDGKVPVSRPLTGAETLYGSMTEQDGVIRTALPSNGQYSTLMFDGVFSDVIIEADFLSHTGGGGFFFRSDKNKASGASGDSFCGYLAFVGKAGTLGAFGAAGDDGKWIGNYAVSPREVFHAGQDLHLRLVCIGDAFCYTVTDKGTGEELYRCEYRQGDAEKDTCTRREGGIGLRMLNDGGKSAFSSLRVTELPTAADTGISLDAGQSLSFCRKAITVPDVFRVGPFVFAADPVSGSVTALEDRAGTLYRVGCRRVPISVGEETLWRVERTGGALRLFGGESDVFLFEFPFLSSAAGDIGASFSPVVFRGIVDDPTGETYTNPIVSGADPEVLYHEGTYYLYTHENGKVVVRTSTDLAHFGTPKICASPIGQGGITSFMSPNVFYESGLFYLIIAARTTGSEYRLFYAVSDTPDGPFTVEGADRYLENVNEIGGAPFRDADGKLYLSLVRFGGGNHIWILPIRTESRRILPAGEAVHLLSPEKDYEVDSYGNIVEGGVFFRHGDRYYMIYASGHYKGHYGQSLCVSDSLFGPYERYPYNEILSSNAYADGVGDCVFVTSPGGELFVMYHRHSVTGNRGASRSICIDRVVFEKDPAGGPDILRIVGPTSTPQPMPE